MENKKEKMDIETLGNNDFNEKITEEFLENEKYYLILDNRVYKIIIGKRKKEIVIKSNKYEITSTLEDFLILMKKNFKTIDELYSFIINLFEENRVFIENIIINKTMKLILRINNNTVEKNIELFLKHENKCKNNNKTYEKKSENEIIIKNKNLEITEEILKLNNEIIFLKKEIEAMQNYLVNAINNKNNNMETFIYTDTNFNSINKIGKKPLYKEEKIEIKNVGFLIEDSYSHSFLDNTFTVFKSVDDILYLIYTNRNMSIKKYDLNENSDIAEKKNAHDNYITNFRQYLDEIDKNNKKNLLLSISSEDNNIKIWDIKNFNC